MKVLEAYAEFLRTVFDAGLYVATHDVKAELAELARETVRDEQRKAEHGPFIETQGEPCPPG